MTHLRLLCISLHLSLLFMQMLAVFSCRQPTWASSPGVLNYCCPTKKVASFLFYFLYFPILQTNIALSIFNVFAITTLQQQVSRVQHLTIPLMLAVLCQTPAANN